MNHAIVDGSIMYGGIESWMTEEYPTVFSESIDCRSNHQLFKAVTAIRDDSDYMQWFYNPKFDRKCILL